MWGNGNARLVLNRNARAKGLEIILDNGVLNRTSLGGSGPRYPKRFEYSKPVLSRTLTIKVLANKYSKDTAIKEIKVWEEPRKRL